MAALAAVAGLIGAAGCTEKLDGSAGCPLTCTDQTAQIQTVVLDAVATDTTVLGGLGKGTEQHMLLASRGDTLDTRVIIRFDSLPARSVVNSKDSATTVIERADSATLSLVVDSAAAKLTVPVTMSLYDVDNSPATDDTSATALASLFTPARLIVAQQFAPGTLVDSIKVQLPGDFIVAKAQAHARLRVGLQLSAATSAMVRIASSETTFGPSLRFRTSTDTAVAAVVLKPYSKTPTNNSSIAHSLGDFTLIVRGTPPPAPGLLAVGGLPGTRAYFRFAIPARIVDSSLVVRATLLLTQQASSSPDGADTMTVQPYLVLAGPAVTDPVKAAQIVAPTTLGNGVLEALKAFPGQSGLRELEIAPVFTYWASQTEQQLPRAVEVQSAQEDYSPQQALFYSAKASDPTVRPKLRISYTLRSRIGLP